ncbi:5329_t:CDS:2, partial [Racocetra fulgida]
KGHVLLLRKRNIQPPVRRHNKNQVDLENILDQSGADKIDLENISNQNNVDEIIELQRSSANQDDANKITDHMQDFNISTPASNKITNYAQESDTSISLDTQDDIDEIEYNTLTPA